MDNYEVPLSDLVYDEIYDKVPTTRRAMTCPECHECGRQVLRFEMQLGDATLRILFRCEECGAEWDLCFEFGLWSTKCWVHVVDRGSSPTPRTYEENMDRALRLLRLS